MNVRRATSILLGFLVVSAMFAVADAGAALRLDAGFGYDGLVKVPGRPGSDPFLFSPEVVAEEADGSLIFDDEDGGLHRLDPAGQIDPSFGTGGTLTPPAPLGGTFELAAATVDAKGRLLMVGTSTPAQPPPQSLPVELNGEIRETEHSDVRLLRYLSDGTLDPDFGEGGIVETDLGLQTPQYEGFGLASAPVVEATGVAIDGSGRIVLTGGAGAGITEGGCFHDDYSASLTYAGFVARFTEAGALDTSFATGGVFGGSSVHQVPLKMEDTADPAIASDESVILQRQLGFGHCARSAGSLGFFALSSAGRVRSSRGRQALHGRVIDAAAAPDGSTVLLLEPPKGSEAPFRVVERHPDGSPDRRFSKDGSATLRLPHPGWSRAEKMAVAADGEIFVGAWIIPPPRRRESGREWSSRYSVGLLGLTPTGKPDARIGMHGLLARRLPRLWEFGDVRLGPGRRVTVTAAYRHGPTGLAAIRFR